MSCGAASSRSVSQPATGASPPDVVAEEAAWETEEAAAATRRAVNALQKVLLGSDGDPLRELLQEVHLHLDASGADRAAKAFTLIADVDRKSLMALRRHVRDVLVLRCLLEMKPKDRGDRDSFLVAVAKAFGQTLQSFLEAPEPSDIILHSYKKCTKNRRDAFLANTQMAGRPRKRRSSLGRRIQSSVASFLAGGDFSDGAPVSDEAEFST